MTVSSNQIPENAPRSHPVAVRIAVIVGLVAVVQTLFVGFIIFTFSKSQVMHAVIAMMICTILLWCVLGGVLTLRYKQVVRRWVLGIPGRWQLKFVVMCTVMALIEEAITVTMTNCAPLFGLKMGQAYITASANYLDVVFCHSVIVFIPQYIALAWVLSRYQMSPASVFLLYGFQGLIGEVCFGGISHITELFWVYIYGLMVYLPTYCIPIHRNAVRIDKQFIWRVLVLFFSPGLFALVVMKVHPIKIHFPPLQP